MAVPITAPGLTRRRFITLTASATVLAGCAAGTIGLVNNSKGITFESPIIDTGEALSEIARLKRQTGDPSTFNNISKYIQEKYPEKVMLDAAEALALRADKRTIAMLRKAFYLILARWDGEGPGKRTVAERAQRVNARMRIAKNALIHYAANPSARENSILLLLELIYPFGVSQWNCWGYWQPISAADWIGNESLRHFMALLQVARETDGDRTEMDTAKLLDKVISLQLPDYPKSVFGHVSTQQADFKFRGMGRRHPRHNWLHVSAEDYAEAKDILLDENADDSSLINAIHILLVPPLDAIAAFTEDKSLINALKKENLTVPSKQASSTIDDDRSLLTAIHVLLKDSLFAREPKMRSRLIQLLHGNRGYRLKRAVIAALGAGQELSEPVHDLLLKFLTSENDDLKIAAARALQWKNGIAFEAIIPVWRKTEYGSKASH
jgi:hypothetical protein